MFVRSYITTSLWAFAVLKQLSMIINNKPTYKCEHCLKLYQRPKACEKHEKACSLNPENYRMCFNCGHCEKVSAVICEQRYDGSKREVEVFLCKAKDHYLIPPKAEHKGNAFEFDNKENHLMVKDCTEYALPYLDDLPF